MKWVTATDLDQWAQTRDSQAQFPTLLRRLIYATAVGLEALDFPSGDSIQAHGWDGLVRTTAASQFVPRGSSGWECSCNGQPNSKAEADYQKRCEKPPPLAAREASFVFATPRRWNGARTWAEEKRAECVWADVRAYDADDLEHWLEQAPAVSAWLANAMGKYPPGLTALDDWWQGWTNATSPPTSPSLLIAGRAPDAKLLKTWLNGPAAPFSLEADTQAEATAFLAAVLAQLPDPEREQAWSRAVVLSREVQFREIGRTEGPLLLVYQGTDLDSLSAPARTYHTYLALARGSYAGEPNSRLPFASRSEFQTGLENMGFPRENAARLAVESGRSVSVLRRRLTNGPRRVPAWAEPDRARLLLPALLAGQWDEAQPGDQDVLARLAGKPYAALSAELVTLNAAPESPCRSSGTCWRLTSDRGAWFLLARYLTAQDLEGFLQISLEVLAAPDLRRELPPEQRWAASFFGKPREHSDGLRHGLASRLALMAVFGEDAGAPTRLQIADRAAIIVSALLHGADRERWATAADLLPTLAEAAPEAFLAAVEQSLGQPQPTIMVLFEEIAGPIGASSEHTGLLWALEGLAWEPLRLGRAALILARLGRLDPGGKLTNRPLASLRHLFLFWCPQTGATPAERQEALEMLLAREPQTGWKLLLSILPSNHETCFPNHRPKWRDFPTPEAVSNGEWFAGVEWLTDQATHAAGTDGTKWAQLVEVFSGFPPPNRRKILHQLAGSLTAIENGRLELWAAIRKVIHNHRRFAGADWAISQAEANDCEAVYSALQPKDPIQALSWLFDHDAPILHPAKDWQANDAIVDAERQQAVASIASTQGIAGLLALAQTAKRPRFVGFAAATAIADNYTADSLLDHLLASPAPALREAGLGLVVGEFAKHGWAWADRQLERGNSIGWSADQQSAFLFGLPVGTDTWTRAAASGAEAEGRYWAGMSPYGQLTQTEREYAVGKLLDASRALDALEMAGHQVDQISAELAARVLRELPAALAGAHGPVRGDGSGHIERLFERLDSTGLDVESIAKLEWPYLALFSHWRRPAAALHRLLWQDPEFFAELIRWQFKPDRIADTATEEPDASADDIARARAANELLRSWRGVPGADAEGAVVDHQLASWAANARQLCAQNRRSHIGDEQIGEALARAHAHTDGVWPALPVREVIESAQSQDLERGIEIGLANKFGAKYRQIENGGAKERELAAQYDAWSQATSLSWTRTSAVLARVAHHFRQMGRLEDLQSERMDQEY